MKYVLIVLICLLVLLWTFSYNHEDLHQRALTYAKADSHIIFFAGWPAAVHPDENVIKQNFSTYDLAQSNIDAQTQDSLFSIIQIGLLAFILIEIRRKK